MYAELVKNRVCRSPAGLRCSLCDLDLGKDQVLSHLVDDQDHWLRLKEVGELKHFKCDESKCIELINHGIVAVNSREYRCTFCLCLIPKFDHISEHVSGKKHAAKRRKALPDYDDNLLDFGIDSQELFHDLPGNQDNGWKDDACGNRELTNVPKDEKEESLTCKLNDVPNAENKNDKFLFSERNSVFENQNRTEESLTNQHNGIPNNQNKKEEPLSLNLPNYCNKCQINLKSEAALQYHKMFHLSQKFFQPSDIVNFSVEENFNKRIYCLLCDHFMRCEEDLARHLKEDTHQKRLIIVLSPDSQTIMNNLFCNSAIQPINFYCEFNRSLYYMGLIINQQRSSLLTSYFCFICNATFVDENLLFLHYHYDDVHKYRMGALVSIVKDKYMQFVSFNSTQVIKCSKCQIHLTELNGIMAHSFDLQHLYEKTDQHNQIITNGQIPINSRNLFACSICKIINMNDYMMICHLTSEYHKRRTQEHYTNINSALFKKAVFYCSQCNMHFLDDKVLLIHLNAHHQIGLNSPALVNNTNYPNNTNNFVNGTSNPVSDIVVSNNLIIQQNDKRPTNIYPMPINNIKHTSNTQQNMYKLDKKSTNTVSSRTKTLIDFSPRYVKLCIERGDENIFKINTEIIRKLELSISLTFPHESNRCCIPCKCEVSKDLQLLYEHFRTESHEKNLQEIEDNDTYFENFRDQFSDLELAKEYMTEDSEEFVKCHACDTIVENCQISLKNHIDSELHINKQQSWKKSANDIFMFFNNIFENLWYYIENFFCNLCCISFESEVYFATHLEDIKHLKEVEKRIMMKQTLKFDCCILCSCYWYAKSDQHKIHCEKDSHTYKLKSRDITVPEMTGLKDLFVSIEETINSLIAESNEAFFNDKDMEKQILESIEKVVKPKYPEVKAYLFGSRISNLGLKNSDLDIYLDCGTEVESESKLEQLLLTIDKCFNYYQDVWKIEESILRTRVPIIKLKHRATNLGCDLSFMNELSVAKSKILGYFVNACLPCQKLILFLKKWSTICQISGRKGINSFAISWFVIFYLQIKEILPSVQELIKLENKSNIIAGWETGVSNTIQVKETDLSIENLLEGFFQYYAEFNYISDVACPFLGKVIKKSKFSDIDSLPDEMSSYKTQVKEMKIEYFRLHSPMCIQDPIDLSQNITKGVTKLRLRIFKSCCTESVTIMKTSKDYKLNK